jgi:hypothetical protein
MATTVATYSITIPAWVPPTANQLFRGTVRQRIKLGKACREMVGWYTLLARVPPAEGKRRVTLRLVLPKGRRFPDVDSLWKGLLDALVCAGALKGDSHLWGELAPVQFGRGAEWGTTITLEDVP